MIKFVKETLDEDAVGGVSGPMSTTLNTPGMGNAQPAKASMNTDGPSGSGDKWGDSSLGMQTNENFGNKIEVEIEPDWTGKYITITAHDISQEDWMELGDNLDQDQLDMSDEVEKEYGIKRTAHQMKYPTDVSYTDYGYSDKIGRWSASTLQDAKNWLELHKDKVYSNSPILNENNLNPYDKIGAMMAKKMGVAQPFKKKDYRTNTIEQNHYDELDEDQPDNTRDFDDYVARPDEVLNNAKKRRVNENKQPYRIDTLDDYVKASKHVPDHPLTLVKKGMLKEEAPRDNEALKDVAAKPELETLGIAYEIKAGPSGQERVFITDPMSEVMDKIAQSDWEEYGKNPQNTIRKWSKGDKILAIYADGKQLPRATVTAKGNEVVEEKLIIKKVVSSSINPYL